MNQVRAAEAARWPRLDLLLLLTETLGVAIFWWDGVPLYNQVVHDISSHKPQPGVLWWALAAIVLIQGSYWLRARSEEPPPWRGHPVISHALLFIARLAFVLVTSIFSFVFLSHYRELDVPPHRVVILVILLFSMFCWTLDIERLARALGETGR